MNRRSAVLRAVVATAATSLVLVAGACSSGDEKSDGPATTGAVSDSSGDRNGTPNDKNSPSDKNGSDDKSGSSDKDGDQPAGNPKENGAATAGIDLENPPEPIAELTVPVNADGVTSTKVEVLQVKREDKVLLMTFRFTPEGTTSKKVSIFASMGQHSFFPELIDLENLKRYKAVQMLTSDTTAAKVNIGESLYGFTAFPLPPKDVETMNLKVSDLAPPIENLPVR